MGISIYHPKALRLLIPFTRPGTFDLQDEDYGSDIKLSTVSEEISSFKKATVLVLPS